MFKKINVLFFIAVIFMFSKTIYASGAISNIPVAEGENAPNFVTYVSPDGGLTVVKSGTNFKVNISQSGEVTVYKDNSTLKIMENGGIEKLNEAGEPVEVEAVANNGTASTPISNKAVQSPPISNITGSGTTVASPPISNKTTYSASGPISNKNAVGSSSVMKKMFTASPQ